MANLGQHFINSDTVSQKVVSAANVSSGDTVFEIGPGKGALTGFLFETGAIVVAVEKDPNLVAFLKEKYAEYIEKDLFFCHEGDVRDELPRQIKDKEYCVVSNIPYYITGFVLRTLLTTENQPTHITLLMQDEVAKRITDTKKESVLSLSIKIFGTPRYIEKVSRTAFTPQPDVDSAIVTITNIHPCDPHIQKTYFSIIKQCFASKRKKISNTAPQKVFEELLKAGIEKNSRPEDVPFTVWLSVARALSLGRDTVV